MGEGCQKVKKEKKCSCKTDIEILNHIQNIDFIFTKGYGRRDTLFFSFSHFFSEPKT